MIKHNQLLDFVNNTLKPHADLVSQGIEPSKALEIISYPIVHSTVKSSLERLNVAQLDELISRLKLVSFELPDQFIPMYISGISNKVHFSDVVMGMESVDLSIEELPIEVLETITKTIREIVS